MSTWRGTIDGIITDYEQPFPHEHGERGFGGERAASLEYIGGGEAAVDR